MSSSPQTLKRHNHRVHPCQSEKKQELLDLLLTRNSQKTILVVASHNNSTIENSNNIKNVTIISDEDLLKQPELKAELVISYDLPEKALTYMSRIAHSTTFALILLDPTEEKLLYPIETLIGRTIMQESIEGFGSVIEPVKELEKKELKKQGREQKAQGDKKEYKKKSSDFKGEKKYGEKPRRDDKPRSAKPYDKDKKPYEKKDGKSEFKKPYDKDKKDDKFGFKKPYNKDKKESKYLGKDENGKAIFSGKSGERNHRYDGKPKEDMPKLTGKKINIKSLKKPKE